MRSEAELRASPLHFRLAAENRLNAWRAWNGMTYPETLAGLAEETGAAADGAALCDLGPLARVTVTGPEAAAALARLCTRDVAALAVGALAETLWLDDAGAVRGLGRVARVAEEVFLLSSEVDDLPWIDAALFGFEASWEDRGGSLTEIGISGPAAPLLLGRLDAQPLSTLEPGTLREGEIRGLAVTALRAGQGSGFGLLCEAEDAPVLWDWLLALRGEMLLAPIGFAARELQRIEAGEPAPGRDFVPAQLCEDAAMAVPPAALGLAHLVDLERGHFNGRRALAAAPAPPRRLCRVLIEEPGDAAYAPVRAGGREIGQTMSAVWSPRANAGLALAWLPEKALLAGETLKVELRREEGLRRTVVEAALRVLL